MKWVQTSNKTLIILFLSVVTILFLSSMVLAVTGKIGNARVVLYPEVDGKTTIDRTILVINDNDFDVDINITASEEFKDIVQIQDNQFTLKAGEQKDARFKIVLKQLGDYDGKLMVYFTQRGEKQGVALASRIIIHATGPGGQNVNATDSGGVNVGGNRTTGNVIKNTGGKISPALIILGVSTLVCVLILVYLMILINNRSKKKNGEVMPTKIDIIGKKKSTKI